MTSEPLSILLATRSRHKANEITTILRREHIRFVTLEDAGLRYTPTEEGIERFATFAGNALAKAEYFAAVSGMAVIADDSGICVDALGGEPGVRSRRFAGRSDLDGPALDAANNDALLARLVGVSGAARAAHYTCAAVFVRDGATPVTALGSVSGVLLESPSGDGGFGYDPLFFLPALAGTFAQVDAALKHRFSHRGRAFRSLAGHIGLA